MQCSVCGTQPAVAQCTVCNQPVCRTCGTICPVCRKPVCRPHVMKSPTTRYACRKCVYAGTTPSVQPPSSPSPEPSQTAKAIPKQSSATSLSFEDLTAELGEIKLHVAEEPRDTEGSNAPVSPTGRLMNPKEETVEDPFALSGPRESAGVGDHPQPQGYKHLRRKPSDDPNEFRILTASSPKPTPMWVSGLMSSLLAFVLSLALIKNVGIPFFPNLFAYSVMFLSGGVIFWNGYGVIFTEDSTFNRLMCIPGIVLGVLALGIAFLFGLH